MPLNPTKTTKLFFRDTAFVYYLRNGFSFCFVDFVFVIMKTWVKGTFLSFSHFITTFFTVSVRNIKSSPKSGYSTSIYNGKTGLFTRNYAGSEDEVKKPRFFFWHSEQLLYEYGIGPYSLYIQTHPCTSTHTHSQTHTHTQMDVEAPTDCEKIWTLINTYFLSGK